MAIDELVAYAARVISYKNGTSLKTGSGFFYENTSGLHYVTNRHMIIKEDEEYFPDKLSLRLHTNPNNIQNNSDLVLTLYSNSKPTWKEHPTHGSKVDVVVIPLNKTEIAEKYFVKAFSPANHIPNDIVVPLGQELMVIGFPKGFHDEKYNLPIVRDATLASVYPVPFQGHPFILIDSRLHKGTSGSPVITKNMNLVQMVDGSTALRTGSTRYLLGIHSASIDIEGTDDKDPLGLNCVWFASLIDEMTR